MKKWEEVKKVFGEEVGKKFPFSPDPVDINVEYIKCMEAIQEAWERICSYND